MTGVVPSPVTITLVRPGLLRIVWDDAGEIVADYPAFLLRVKCPCAGCTNETTGERLLDPGDVPPDVTIEDAGLTGNYAVSLDFSDGHTTGIYSWKYLVDLTSDDELRDRILRRD